MSKRETHFVNPLTLPQLCGLASEISGDAQAPKKIFSQS